MRQLLPKTSTQPSSAKSKVQSPSPQLLLPTINTSIQLLLDGYDSSKHNRNPTLVLALFDGSEEFDNSWTYTEADGSSVSIPDYIENLIIEHNEKLGERDRTKAVKAIDVSVLVFVAEHPVKVDLPASDSGNSKKRAASESPSASDDDEEEPTKKSKLQDSTPSSNAGTSRSAFTYSNSPYTFCNGNSLPKTRAETAFKFVRMTTSFIRPSYASQAISDLACAIYNLKELHISEIPTKNPLSAEHFVLPNPGSLLVPTLSYSPLQKFMPSTTKSTPIVGHYLGAGSWNTPIKYSVRRWTVQDNPIGLTARSSVKVTPKSLRNVASGSLLASTTDRRPLFISSLPMDTDAPISQGLLICDGSHIYFYEVSRNDMPTELIKALPNVSRAELLLRSSRLKSMCGLMIGNTFNWTTFNAASDSDPLRRKDHRRREATIELELGASRKSGISTKHSTILPSDSHTTRKYKTTRGLELATRIFPLTDDSSLLYAPNLPDSVTKHIAPLITAITATDIPVEYHPMLLEHVKSLAILAAHNDVTSFPYTKTAVAKRRELYTQLWTELLTLVAAFADVSAHHKLFADLVRHAAPDQALANSILSPLLDSTIDLPHSQNATKPSSTGASGASSSAMDVDSASSAKAVEQQWLKDVESVRHDIVGMKDASWALGAKMTVPEVPLPIAEMSPNSLYSRYWQAAKERKGLGTHLKN